MRIYGSSPLYNYVELVFRCKRLFIVAVILGTVITSAAVFMRADRYETTMVIQLSGGDPDLARNLSTDERNTNNTGFTRKASRFVRWVQRDPDFVSTALKDISLDRKYGARFDDLVKKVRKAIPTPNLDDQYMEVTLNWKDPVESVDILNAIYSRYALRTLEMETATSTSYRQLLEQEYNRAEKTANEKAQQRVLYLRDHYWAQPTLMGSSMATLDQTDNQIADVQLDISDANVRLAEITRQLRGTARSVSQGQEVTSIRDDPALRLISERQDLEVKLKQYQNIYSDLHPKVKELQRQIEDLDAQIKSARAKKTVPNQQTTKVNTIVNPAWQELNQQRQQLVIAARAQRNRLSQLLAIRSKRESNVMRMPQTEIDFSKVEREYTLADNIRKNLQSRLAAARLQEEQDKVTKAKEMALAIPPKAERLDSGGKTLLLCAIGPILGLIIAFAFALGAETLDHTLRTPVEVEQYLGKPVLAVIPRVRGKADDRKRLGGANNQKISS